MASWEERLTRISAEITDVKRVVVVVVVAVVHPKLLEVEGKKNNEIYWRVKSPPQKSVEFFSNAIG